MSSNWRAGKLGEFIELKRGYDLPQAKRVAGNVPLLSSSGLTDYHAQAMVKGPGVVTGRYGTIGQVYFVDDDFWPLNTTLYVRDFKGNDPKFISYFLRTIDFHAYSDKAAVPGLNRNHLHEALVVIPDGASQRRIAEILGAFDDRITLLRETNATLEAIAQALFKSWFVDFDPVRAKAEGRDPDGVDAETAGLFPSSFEESELGESPTGWRTGTLGDLAQTARSQRRPSDFDASIHYVGLEHIPRGSLSLTSWGNAAGLESAKSSFQEGDILFGKLRPYFHKVVVAPFNGVCSTDILVCQPKFPAFYGVVAMHLFSKPLIDYADRLSNGAKMPRVNWKDLAAYPIVLPPEPLAECYRVATEPLVQSIIANVHKAKTLSDLRDTLLPRLISGQLRLPEAEANLRDAA